MTWTLKSVNASRKLTHRKLSEYAGKLDRLESVDEWKGQMTHLLKQEYDRVTNKSTICHFTIDGDKQEGVTKAVEGGVGQLNAVLEECNLAGAAVDTAERRLSGAEGSVWAVNTTLLGLLRHRGNTLCEMSERHAKVQLQLNEVNVLLKTLKSNAIVSATRSAEGQQKAILASAVVLDIMKGVATLPPVGCVCVHMDCTAARNSAVVNANVTGSIQAAALAVEHSGEANTRIGEVMNLLKGVDEKFIHVDGGLGEKLDKADIRVDVLNATQCNEGLRKLVDGEWLVAPQRAAQLSATKLQQTDVRLKELGTLAIETELALTSIMNKERVAEWNAEKAIRHMHKAVRTVSDAVTDVLRGVMSGLCASVAEMRMLRLNVTLLKGLATGLKGNVSSDSDC
ncbi:hypothetical protein TRVL_08931 [Trypanosoma vivax]|nr:hypothetical protein TRVL_08931 [Trypanosoma vivax]